MEWRRIIVSAYGPTLLASIGHGAAYPLIALSALSLGASVPTSALIVGLMAIGKLVGDLPAGALASRFGERTMIVAACVVDAAALIAIWGWPSLAVLACGVFATGLAAAVFGLARQAYLTEAIPVTHRARALSSLGGVFRIGYFVGPLAGAWLVTHYSIGAAYLFASGLSLLAAAVTLALPDLPSGRNDRLIRVSTWSIVREHAKTFATSGVAVLLISLTRSARFAALPLWCAHIGLDAAQTSLIVAVSMALDVALFFPGGAIMDRFGRTAVAVPAMVIMGIGLIALPLAQDAWWVAGLAALMGLGNGLSSGVVMTLGSDASPTVGRPQFLAAWRLASDSGDALGPVVITGITALAPLATAAFTVGLVSLWGGAWTAYWVRGSR